MAAVGSTQLREKTLLDTQVERLSIEREIRDIMRDQASVLEDEQGIEKKTIEMLRKRANQMIAVGRRRQQIEDDILLATKKETSAKGTAQKQAFKAQIISLERELKKQEKIAEKIRLKYSITKDQAALQKKLKEAEQKQIDKAVSYSRLLGDIFQRQATHYSNLQAMFPKLRLSQLLLASSLLAIGQTTFEVFKTMDDSLAKFRITMGMMRKDAYRISLDIREVATQFANVGVTVENAAEAAMALANEFGGTMKVSKDLVETTALLKAQLGVAEESSAGFLRNMGALAKTSAQSQRYMVYMADAMTAAAGIPLNLVMQDVAKLSGNALALISKMPLAIVKTTVEARKMGTTVNKMADASAQLLNFTESVQSEMEASVLLGQAINLQRARELAYAGKLVESTKEILSIAKRIDFEHLDYFQMQAFAAASGRSADELLRMIQAERQLREARNIPGLREEVALYDSLQARQEAALKNDALQRELTVQRMANQSRMNALQQQWNQLWMETMRVMYPVLSTLIGLATVAVRIGPPILFVGKTIAWIADRLVYIGAGASKFSSFATKIYNGFAKVGVVIGGFVGKLGVVGKVMGGIGGAIGSIGKYIGVLKFAAPFAKAIPVVGWIITALQLIGSGIKNFTKFARGEISFGTALKNIIYDVFLAPFVGVWKWIKKIFIGESPSELGIGIVRGLIAVQAKVFDALTSPWRRFLAWIAEKIPGMGGIAEKIRGGMTGALGDLGVLEKKTELENKNRAVTESPAVVKVATMKTELSPEQQRQKDDSSGMLAGILKGIQELNANLLAGNIAVNIDGQLASNRLSRQTAFLGGYGVNNVNAATG